MGGKKKCKPWMFIWTHSWSWQTTLYLGEVVPPGKVEGPLSQWTGAIVHRLADPIVLSCHVETPALKVNVQYFRNIFSENYTSRNIHALNTVWKRLYASINPLIWYGSLFCMYLETIIRSIKCWKCEFPIQIVLFALSMPFCCLMVKLIVRLPFQQTTKDQPKNQIPNQKTIVTLKYNLQV